MLFCLVDMLRPRTMKMGRMANLFKGQRSLRTVPLTRLGRAHTIQSSARDVTVHGVFRELAVQSAITLSAEMAYVRPFTISTLMQCPSFGLRVQKTCIGQHWNTTVKKKAPPLRAVESMTRRMIQMCTGFPATRRRKRPMAILRRIVEST